MPEGECRVVTSPVLAYHGQGILSALNGVFFSCVLFNSSQISMKPHESLFKKRRMVKALIPCFLFGCRMSCDGAVPARYITCCATSASALLKTEGSSTIQQYAGGVASNSGNFERSSAKMGKTWRGAQLPWSPFSIAFKTRQANTRATNHDNERVRSATPYL